MTSTKRARREAKALFRMCLKDGELDEHRTMQVASRIAAAGRRDSRTLLLQFLRLVKFHQAMHAAAIESATPLTEDLRTAIETSLLRRYGRTLAMSYSHHPELIGGVRIQVASDVYDNTVLAGLQALEKTF